MDMLNTLSTLSSPTPEHQWEQSCADWCQATNWQLKRKALVRLVTLDRHYFRYRLLPLAASFLRSPLPHNMTFLKILAHYGETLGEQLPTNPVSPAINPETAAGTLWSLWDESLQRVRAWRAPDGNQMAHHLMAMGILDRSWFPGRLRPLLFQLMLHPSDDSLHRRHADRYLFKACQKYMQLDQNQPSSWQQWHETWKQVLDSFPPSHPAFWFAMESLIYLDEHHLPGTAHAPICRSLTFASELPFNTLRVLRRYTLRTAPSRTDELVFAWQTYQKNNPFHSTVVSHLLNRLHHSTPSVSPPRTTFRPISS